MEGYEIVSLVHIDWPITQMTPTPSSASLHRSLHDRLDEHGGKRLNQLSADKEAHYQCGAAREADMRGWPCYLTQPYVLDSIAKLLMTTMSEQDAQDSVSFSGFMFGRGQMY